MWLFQERYIKNICDFGDSIPLGFVYKITNKRDRRIYIGRKMILCTRRVKIPLKKKKELNTRKIYETVTKETDWKSYTGSCKKLNYDIEQLGLDNFEFEILELSYTKKQLSYSETKHQFLFRVLENNSYNENILGKWYSKDI